MKTTLLSLLDDLKRTVEDKNLSLALSDDLNRILGDENPIVDATHKNPQGKPRVQAYKNKYLIDARGLVVKKENDNGS